MSSFYPIKKKDFILATYCYGKCPCAIYEYTTKYEKRICNFHNDGKGSTLIVAPKIKNTQKNSYFYLYCRYNKGEREMSKSLFETELEFDRPSNMEGSAELDSIRPRIKWETVQKVKARIDTIKGYDSYTEKSGKDVADLTAKMEIWLAGLNQDVPKEFSDLSK